MSERDQVSRRTFFKLGAVGAAAALAAAKSPAVWAATSATGTAAAAATGTAAATATKGDAKVTPKIGVQMYSVRDEAPKDLAGALAKIAKMGYKGVEFAGYYNKNAKDLRKMLDDNGLACCGSHIGMDIFAADKVKATIDFHQTLGNKFLTVAMLGAKTKQDWMNIAKQFNDASDKIVPAGLRTGYHSHAGDFKAVEGEKPWDIIFANTKPEVNMQFDTGNGMDGGADVITYLKKFPGRCQTLHCKASSKKNPKAPIGEDELPWKDIFDLAESQNKTEWYIVEYEIVGGAAAFDAIDKCFQGLKKLGKA
jgi:sugar phosphate isomerase/epimerase